MTNQLEKESKQWQAMRMPEAKLSPKEAQELTEFLRGRTGKLAAPAATEPDAVVSFQDVQELLAWLQERIASTNISEVERKQVNDWLVTLLTKSPALTRPELETIKLTLIEQFAGR